ncbi:MAG TPA: hypothetical protein VHX92_04240 [Rhizomicrobium sp.]|jgi:hypothetical protein|nr:hypothetical protein [Rhizomicrobium sp.]
MAGTKQANKSNTKATMTDAAIKASTGRDWMTWFAALDKAGAAKLDHKAIVALAREMGSGRWYGQMVAVSYERARGLRAMNQKCDGEFSVSVTRVMDVPLPKLYAAATKNPATWFPKGKFEETSRTKDKYWRGKWNRGRLEVGFYAKGVGRAQIALQSNKLAGEAMVEKERALWKKAIDRLQAITETTS